MPNHCKKCQCKCSTCYNQGDNKCNGNPCECHTNLEEKILKEFDGMFLTRPWSEVVLYDEANDRTLTRREYLKEFILDALKEQREEMLRMLPPEKTENVLDSDIDFSRKALLGKWEIK